MMRPTSCRLRRRTVAAVVAAVTMLGLAACGAPAESPGGSGQATTTLTLGIQGAPSSFDPTELNEGTSGFVWDSVYDTLLAFDKSGELQPNAAERWRYSKDRKTLTLELREGMTFSTGAPVDAAAVKTTLERTIETPGPHQGKVSMIESVETPDDHTVVLHLNRPDAYLLAALAMAPGVIGDPATLDAERTALNPVGSGAYELDMQNTVTGSKYLLKRRDDYWNVDAFPFETVEIRVISDKTAVFNALQAGELNAATIETQHTKALEQLGFTTTEVKGSSVAKLMIADREGEVQPALADPRVRKAINMAFDRAKFVNQFLRGSGMPTVQVFNSKGDGYVSELEGYYKHDPKAARDLMAEAGYADGFTVTMPSLFFSKPFEPIITQALSDIGITAEWEPVPPQKSVAAIASKKYPMFFFVEGVNTEAREAFNNYGPDGYLNPFHVTDDTVSGLLEEINAEGDPETAAALYQELTRYVVENAWDAPLFYISTNWATKDGIEYQSDGSVSFSSVRHFGVKGQ